LTLSLVHPNGVTEVNDVDKCESMARKFMVRITCAGLLQATALSLSGRHCQAAISL
jgi:hypothetical protein